MTARLTTPRLVLEPVSGLPPEVDRPAGDVPGLLRGRGWPSADTHATLAWIAVSGVPAWLMVRRADRTVVGECGWKRGPGPDGTAEICYGVAPPSRRRRYGTEAVGALAAWALARPDCRRLLAEVHVTNLPSRRLLERVGFALDDVDGVTAWYVRSA